MRGGMVNSSSSVETSVPKVGLTMDEAGSTEATLDRIDGMDAFDKIRAGHLGGESGDTGLTSSTLGLGVAGACEKCGSVI